MTSKCGATLFEPCIVAVLAACLVPLEMHAAGDAPELTPVRERVPLFTLIPDYPKIARRDRIEGKVQVCFEITRAGKTKRVTVRRTTNRLFNKAAVRAVKRSTYVPLEPHEIATYSRTCRIFRFSLEPVDDTDEQ